MVLLKHYILAYATGLEVIIIAERRRLISSKVLLYNETIYGDLTRHNFRPTFRYM
jgi:hypothetical protein